MKLGSNPHSSPTKDGRPPLDLSPASSGEDFLRPVPIGFKIWMVAINFAFLAWLFGATNPYKGPAVIGCAILVVPALIWMMGLGNRLWAAFLCTITTAFLAWNVFHYYH